MSQSSSIYEITFLIEQGRYTEAMQSTEAILSLTEDEWLLHHLAGLCCFGMGEFSRALEFFQTAHKVRPLQQASILGIAAAYIRVGQLSEALLYFKISLTVSEETNLNLVPGMLNFHENLNRWRDYAGLVEAYKQWAEGNYNEAIAAFEAFQLTRDPLCAELYALLRWYYLTCRYAKALETVIDLNRHFSNSPHHQLLAAEVLDLIGDADSLSNTLDIALTMDDHSMKASAMALAYKNGLILPSALSVMVDQWWQDLPKLTLPNVSNAVKCTKLSIAIVFADFHANSPSVWLLRSLDYLYHSDAEVTIYLGDCDAWSRRIFRDYGYKLIDTEQLDDKTLMTIMLRNNHEVIWDCTPFGRYQRLPVLLSLPMLRVGMLSHSMHLSKGERNGFDIVISAEGITDNITNNITNNIAGRDSSLIENFRLHHFSDMFLMPLESSKPRLSLQNDPLWIIGLAIRPSHVAPLSSFLCGLLQLPFIGLSFDQDLLGEVGQEKLIDALSVLPALNDVDGRVFLHDELGYLSSDHVEDHLSVVDAYFSVGMPIYDRAALSMQIPCWTIPNVIYEDDGLMASVLSELDEGRWQPNSQQALLDRVSAIAEKDQRLKLIQEFEQVLAPLSEPGRNLDQIHKWINYLATSEWASCERGQS